MLIFPTFLTFSAVKSGRDRPGFATTHSPAQCGANTARLEELRQNRRELGDFSQVETPGAHFRGLPAVSGAAVVAMDVMIARTIR
jgi:hypothetical protein